MQGMHSMKRATLGLGLLLCFAACNQSPVAGAAGKTGTGPDANPTRKLITWADIESKYVGHFNIPGSREEGTEHSFAYTHAVHGQLDNGNLLVTGHPHYEFQAEVKLPDVLNGGLATRVGPWKDITGGLKPPGWSSGSEAYILGGLLQVGERIHFTKHQWYNGAGTDWPSQGYFEKGKSEGMWKVAAPGAHSQRVGGYMSPAPAVLAAEGYTYLAGQQGTSGTATGRWGPNLFAIKADAPRIAGALASRPLVYHDEESRSPEGWWVADGVSGAIWLETPTHHGVLFFLTQQLGGETWYGEANEGVGSPYEGSKGYHASGYALKVWIYDPEDLLEVFRGKKPAWAVRKVEEKILIERAPGSKSETHHSFVTGGAKQSLQVSYHNGRLVILQPHAYKPGQFDTLPKGYVLKIE